MTALARTFIILAMAMSNLVVGSFTLVLFIVLVAVYSFWRRFVHFGGNPRFGGGFCHFGDSLIGSQKDGKRGDAPIHSLRYLMGDILGKGR